MKKAWLHLALIALLACASTSALALSYTATDITDLLGGGIPRDINNAGQIVGSFYVSASYCSHVFLYTPGSGVTDLGTLGGTSSYAYCINDAGQIAGEAYTATGQRHAFLYTPESGTIDLGALLGGTSFAQAINNVGQVVGYSDKIGTFLYTPGSGMTALPLNANDINDAGQVVGMVFLTPPDGSSRACLYAPDTGKVYPFGHSLSDPDSMASAINNAGEVVGWFHVAAENKDHMFLYTRHGGVTDLGNPAGTYIMPCGINEAGWIAGSSPGPSPFVYTPDSGIIQLDPGGTAKAINDAGVVVGYSYLNGSFRAILWTPIPEPSSLAALLAGLAGFGAVMRRRRR